jgi:hypothetical protein
MKIDFVIVAEGSCDSSLRILSVALCNFLLGNDEYATGFCKGNGRTQAGNAASDYDEIRLRRDR